MARSRHSNGQGENGLLANVGITRGGGTGGNTKDEIVVDVPPARRQRTNQGLSPDLLALASSPAAAAAARSAVVARGKGRGRGAGRQGGRGGRRGRH
jgi:hypothetical protein